MNIYKKDFDWWNVFKKFINYKEPYAKFYKEREVWWCSFGVNIGVEIDGKNTRFERPALIIKKFNNEMLWVLPATT